MDVYSFGIDFCQIWYVFNLLKQVLGPFFMVLDLFFHFYFWTRNGSKMGFRPLVFKGLKQDNEYASKQKKQSFIIQSSELPSSYPMDDILLKC